MFAVYSSLYFYVIFENFPVYMDYLIPYFSSNYWNICFLLPERFAFFETDGGRCQLKVKVNEDRCQLGVVQTTDSPNNANCTQQSKW